LSYLNGYIETTDADGHTLTSTYDPQGNRLTLDAA
jgi:YD repeat-containing protein